MATFYHYTDAKGILAIIQSGKILKQEGNEHYALGEAVFLTRVIKACTVDELLMRGRNLPNQYKPKSLELKTEFETTLHLQA